MPNLKRNIQVGGRKSTSKIDEKIFVNLIFKLEVENLPPKPGT